MIVDGSRRHVTGPDPGILDRLRNILLAPDLDAPPVEDQEEGDGGPDDAPQEAAAKTHLQSQGDGHQRIN